MKPAGRLEVPATPDGSRATVHAKLGNEIVLQLPPVTNPGDRWTIVLHDPRFLRQLRPIAAAPDGGATVSFLAIRQGRRMIRFLALPAAYREATTSQSYEAVIEIE